METERDSFAEELFTRSRLGPKVLTQKAIEDYLTRGRQMRSVYAVDLFTRWWRLVGTGLRRASAWLFKVNRKMEIGSTEPFHGFFRGDVGEINPGRRHDRWDKPHSCQPCG